MVRALARGEHGPSAMQEVRAFRLQPGGCRALVSVRDLGSGIASSASERVEFSGGVPWVERRFQGLGPGWRADMGRICGEYGPHDQVESQAFRAGAPAVEVRTHSRPFRRLRLEVRDGFGRFALVSPVCE